MTTSLQLENVSLQFNLRKYRGEALKSFFLDGLFRRSKNPLVAIEALKNINLQISEGERLGIVGHNGAGKSTLLKVLAGVYLPTSGVCRIQGEVSSLFDLQLGFEPHASGWDNIAYRGYLQGETPKSLRGKMQAIAEFSELGDRLDTEIRHYSSGMKVRLAFSIATAIDPEILLVDEVLSAGDLSFQQKARQRMTQMIERARLIVMVSHDLNALRKFCTRVIWLDHGQVCMDGPAHEVVDAYERKMQGPAGSDEKPAPAAAALKIAS